MFSSFEQDVGFKIFSRITCYLNRVGLLAQIIKHENKIMPHLLNLNHAEMSERKVLEASVFGSGGGFVCQLDSLQIYSCFMTSRERRHVDIVYSMVDVCCSSTL